MTVVSILSAPSARRRRLTDLQRLQAKRDERQARRELYPRDYLAADRGCSNAIPRAWRGVSPVVLAEFQVGEIPDGAA